MDLHPVTTLVGFGLFTFNAILFFSRTFASSLEKIVVWRPSLIFSVPLFLVGLYAMCAYNEETLTAKNLLAMSVYFFLPTGILWAANRLRSSAHLFAQKCWWIAIFLVAALLWIPFDFRVITRALGPDGGFAVIAILTTTLTFLIFRFSTYFKSMEHPRVVTHAEGISCVFWGYGILLFILIPLGTILPSPSGDPFLDASSLAKNYSAQTFFLMSVVYLLSVAVPEELLFRGIIQYALERMTRRPMVALIIASVIFGAAHLENGAREIATCTHLSYFEYIGCAVKDPLVWISGWDWSYMLLATIAGGVYGYIFIVTRSLAYPAILHAIIDGTRHAFFG